MKDSADLKRLKKQAQSKVGSTDTDGIQYNERAHIIVLSSDNRCNIKTDYRRKEQIKSINQTYLY